MRVPPRSWSLFALLFAGPLVGPWLLGGCGSLIGVDDFSEEGAGDGSVEADRDAVGAGGAAGTGGGTSTAVGAGGGTPSPVLSWASLVGGPGEDVAQVAASGADDHWFAGFIEGPVDFGAGSVGGTGRQAFFAAIDDQGELRFARATDRMGGVHIDFAAMARQGAGAVAVGALGSAFVLDGVSLPVPNGTDGVALWLSPGGTVQAGVQLGGSGTQLALGIATASDGSAVVVGTFTAELIIGTETLAASGGGDVFVAGFDSGGDLDWVRGLGDSADQRATSVVRDAAGWVVAGTFAGTLAADGTTLTSTGPGDGFVVRFDDTGTLQAGRTFATGGRVEPLRAVVDEGAVWLGGTFRGATSFDGVEATTTDAPKDWDAFAVRLDASLEGTEAVVWGDATGSEAILALAVDAEGLLTGGEFSASALELGGQSFSSAGDTDGFAVLLGATRQPEWAFAFGRNDADQLVGASLRPGAMIGIGTVGSGVSIDETILPGKGGADIVMFSVAR